MQLDLAQERSWTPFPPRMRVGYHAQKKSEGATNVYKHLLVATDGSRLSGKAVTNAIALAQALKAESTAFYASPDYPLPAYADRVVYEPISTKQYETMSPKES